MYKTSELPFPQEYVREGHPSISYRRNARLNGEFLKAAQNFGNPESLKENQDRLKNCGIYSRYDVWELNADGKTEWYRDFVKVAEDEWKLVFKKDPF